MKTRLLILFTRTPLHVGAGSSVGVVDQPIIRESHTGFPVIPGSSVKGVFRDWVRRDGSFGDGSLRDWFGSEPAGAELQAGSLSFGEARLLGFPLRSAKGAFAMATCPLALSRFARDLGPGAGAVPAVADDDCLAGQTVTLEGMKVALEEYVFRSRGPFPSEWAGRLSSLLDDGVLGASRDRWALLSDGDFSHFAKNACPVQQHVGIDPETGTAKDGALFNTETVPSETLFYAPLAAVRTGGKIAGPEAFFERLSAGGIPLQFGGDITTGLGFCAARLLPEKGN